MSGTRSHSRTGPATSFGAIIVSHGQPSDPDTAETELAVLRDRVAPLAGAPLLSATLAHPDALETALAAAGPAPVIYPLFMTDGWFTRTALPKRVSRNDARILPPLGTDPALPMLACRWLTTELEQRNWQAQDTCVVIASHGSGRSPNSARDTQAFADALGALIPFGEVRVGYVEQAPFLAEALADAGTHAICLPFFAARRGHVLEDIPEALDQSGFSGPCLDPIGLHPDIPTLIARAIETAPQPEPQT